MEKLGYKNGINQKPDFYRFAGQSSINREVVYYYKGHHVTI